MREAILLYFEELRPSSESIPRTHLGRPALLEGLAPKYRWWRPHGKTPTCFGATAASHSRRDSLDCRRA